MFSKLQYISQGNSPEEHFSNIRLVLDAGCQWIQLRIKQKERLLEVAEKTKLLCSEYNSILIINDHIEVAKEIDSDGVHLGLLDSSVYKARNILGSNKIIGGTANSLVDVLQRIEEKCDYVGLGPYKFTLTKENISPIIGLEGYKQILSSISENNIPIYAIGGIELNDVAALLKTKIFGIALSGAITKAENKKEYINTLKTILYG